MVVRGFGAMVHLSGGRGAFLDPARFRSTRLFEENWRMIRDEALAVVTRGEDRNIQEIFQEQNAITQGDRWRSYIFKIHGYFVREHMEACPRTALLIRQDPGISSAMFSILAPGASLKAHRGPYKGVLRYHLALVVPGAGTECVLEVGGIRKHWVEGESLLFDDTYLHSAHNDSKGMRVVLFLDVVRALPFPLDRINRFLLWAIARSEYVQGVLRNMRDKEHVNPAREWSPAPN